MVEGGESKMGFIYKITNIINQKIYIGLTTKEKAKERYYQHRYLARHLSSQDNSILHKAMAKEGLDNFSFEVIEEIDNVKLPEREQYWIIYYNSKVPNGYNITDGGEGTSGFSRPQTLEEREKRRQSQLKFFEEHPEARMNMSQKMKKRMEKPEEKQRLINAGKQFHKDNPGIFAGENNPFYGKHHTTETIAKIKESSKQRYKPIAKLDKDSYEILQVYDGVKEAEKDLHSSHGWLSKAARQDKVAYGYRWKFIESVTTNCNSEISTE